MSAHSIYWIAVVLFGVIVCGMVVYGVNSFPIRILAKRKRSVYIGHLKQSEETLSKNKSSEPITGFQTEKSDGPPSLRGLSSAQITAITAATYLFIVLVYGEHPIKLFVFSGFMMLVYISAGIDSRFFLLFDNLSFPLLCAGLVSNAFGLFCNLHEALAGIVIVFIMMISIWYIGQKLFPNSVLGLGDVKFTVAIAAWLGVKYSLMFLWLAGVSFFLVATVCRLATVLPHRKQYSRSQLEHENEQAMGPYYAVSSMMTLLMGGIINEYPNWASLLKLV